MISKVRNLVHIVPNPKKPSRNCSWRPTKRCIEIFFMTYEGQLPLKVARKFENICSFLFCFQKCGAYLSPNDVKVAQLLFSSLDAKAGVCFDDKLALTVGPSNAPATGDSKPSFFPCPTLGCSATHATRGEVSRVRCQECKNELCLACRSFYHFAESCSKFQLWVGGYNRKVSGRMELQKLPQKIKENS